MANRSYLYASDVLPPQNAPVSDKMPYRSISEWNYDIPICFKLLLSCNPEARRSAIWNTEDPIAFVADYEAGLAALKDFLGQIDFPGAHPLINEALAFLEKSENRRRHFVLEAGEIFDLKNEPMATQSAKLLRELQGAQEQATALLVSLRQVPPPTTTSWLSRLLGGKKPAPAADPLMPIYKLGLGNWSNILYFDFGET